MDLSEAVYRIGGSPSEYSDVALLRYTGILWRPKIALRHLFADVRSTAQDLSVFHIKPLERVT